MNDDEPQDDLDVGVPKGEGTDPGDVAPDYDRLKRHLPFFERDVALVALKDDGKIYATAGDYGEEDPDDRIDHYFKRESGGVVQLLGDFNGWAVYRYVQRAGDMDAANDRGTVAKVTWTRWRDEFEHIDERHHWQIANQSEA